MKNYVKPEAVFLEICANEKIAAGMAGWLEYGLEQSNITLSKIEYAMES